MEMTKSIQVSDLQSQIDEAWTERWAADKSYEAAYDITSAYLAAFDAGFCDAGKARAAMDRCDEAETRLERALNNLSSLLHEKYEEAGND